MSKLEWIIPLAVIGWLLCGLLAGRRYRSIHKRDFKIIKWDRSDESFAWFLFLAGIVGLFAIYIEDASFDDKEVKSFFGK